MERPALICKGELLLGLRYFRNIKTDREDAESGELPLGLRPSETDAPSVRGRRTMSYYLVTVLPKLSDVLESSREG